jgi:hypothetical protein
MQTVRRIVGAPLPGDTIPYLPLRRPGPGIGGKIEGTVISSCVLGIATHYLSQRTIPCTKHLGQCEGCDQWRRKANWCGYLGVRASLDRKDCIFQISKGAADACPDLNTLGETLRGLHITLYRKGESAQAGMVCVFREGDGKRLPPPPNVLASLARLWEVDPRYLGRIVGEIEQGGEA